MNRGPLDVFSKRRVPNVGGRFLAARKLRDRAADALWLGILAAEFDDAELRLLATLGYLSPGDQMILRTAGRDAWAEGAA